MKSFEEYLEAKTYFIGGTDFRKQKPQKPPKKYHAPAKRLAHKQKSPAAPAWMKKIGRPSGPDFWDKAEMEELTGGVDPWGEPNSISYTKKFPNKKWLHSPENEWQEQYKTLNKIASNATFLARAFKQLDISYDEYIKVSDLKDNARRLFDKANDIIATSHYHLNSPDAPYPAARPKKHTDEILQNRIEKWKQWKSDKTGSYRRALRRLQEIEVYRDGLKEKTKQITNHVVEILKDAAERFSDQANPKDPNIGLVAQSLLKKYSDLVEHPQPEIEHNWRKKTSPHGRYPWSRERDGEDDYYERMQDRRSWEMSEEWANIVLDEIYAKIKSIRQGGDKSIVNWKIIHPSK